MNKAVKWAATEQNSRSFTEEFGQKELERQAKETNNKPIMLEK